MGHPNKNNNQRNNKRRLCKTCKKYHSSKGSRSSETLDKLMLEYEQTQKRLFTTLWRQINKEFQFREYTQLKSVK